MSEHYFTFPLAVLNGPQNGRKITPVSCIEAALSIGIFNAGHGYYKVHGSEAFKERLAEECGKLELSKTERPAWNSSKADILVGASLCGVSLGNSIAASLRWNEERLLTISTEGPLVCMKSKFFWAALKQARFDADEDNRFPELGISWREFRILCAILSVKRNRAEYSFIGWETIQARACGFTTKDAFKARKTTPDHLAPPLSRRIIRDTCDALEDLGFFARFRLSSGPTGGLMAYSFRHDRQELARVVCESVNFRDRVRIRENRAADMAKCLELLERAKSETSDDQQ